MIVVTGGYGFIGSNLINELLNRGHKNIICIDYAQRPNYTPKKGYFTAFPDHFFENIKSYEKTFGKTEAIFHEGAISSTTETDWSKLFDKNIKCTLNLIYNCRDNEIPLQYASSASVYGNPTIEEWHSKNKKTNPLNLYAKSKREIDYIANIILKSKNPPIFLQGMRYFNVYGPNEDHKGDQASPYHKFEKQLKEIGKIKLFEGSEKYYRDFISVEEVIKMKLKAFEEKQSGIFDIGTGIPKSFYDVAIEICEKNEKDPNKVIEYINMPDNLKDHYQAYSKAIVNYNYCSG